MAKRKAVFIEKASNCEIVLAKFENMFKKSELVHLATFEMDVNM